MDEDDDIQQQIYAEYMAAKDKQRTLSVKCEEGNHHACKPWGNPDDLHCDCPCHEDFD